jgi:hypothetical protein
VEGHENSSITVIATCSDRDHEERERDVRYTRVSILMVVLYFVCHAPRIITNTVEMAVASDKIPIVSSYKTYEIQFEKYKFIVL